MSPLPWDERANAEGRVWPSVWIGLGIFVLIVIVSIWAATRPAKETFSGGFAVFTAEEEDCATYIGRDVTITHGDELLWQGIISEAPHRLRIPALGCEASFYTDPIPVVDDYEVSIENIGTHTFEYETVADSYDTFAFDDICPRSQKPCELREGQGTYVGVDD